MVTTARTRVDAEVKALKEELERAEEKKRENTGCFKDALTGFKTIISFGVTCAMMD